MNEPLKYPNSSLIDKYVPIVERILWTPDSEVSLSLWFIKSIKLRIRQAQKNEEHILRAFRALIAMNYVINNIEKVSQEAKIWIWIEQWIQSWIWVYNIFQADTWLSHPDIEELTLQIEKLKTNEPMIQLRQNSASKVWNLLW